MLKTCVTFSKLCLLGCRSCWTVTACNCSRACCHCLTDLLLASISKGQSACPEEAEEIQGTRKTRMTLTCWWSGLPAGLVVSAPDTIQVRLPPTVSPSPLFSCFRWPCFSQSLMSHILDSSSSKLLRTTDCGGPGE
jgi:hypothetical protein